MKQSTVIWCIVIAIVVGWGVMGNANSSHNNSTETTNAKIEQSKTASKNAKPNISVKNPSSPKQYADSRWPTHNSQLLAIPKSQRWYNAGKHVGTNCTLAGPVKNVYQAKDSNGMPIFIDVGAAYPSSSGFTLLVWADAYDSFAEMINAVDHGDAWLQVSGYLSSYNGRPQFNINDGGVEYTWWTNVS